MTETEMLAACIVVLLVSHLVTGCVCWDRGFAHGIRTMVRLRMRQGRRS